MSLKQRPSLFGRISMGLVFLFLYAPIFVLIVFSFNNSKSRTVWQGFTLKWYAELFQDSQIMNSLYTTLLVALLSAAIATVAGTFASIGFYNMKRRVREPLMTVNNIPMMNADIVTGVSLCLFFVAAFAGWNSFVTWMEQTYRLTAPRLSMGFGTLLIAHIAFNVPYVIFNVTPKLKQLDIKLYEAALDLGCDPKQAFFKVILPEISPAILSAFLICLTYSIDDFMISYFNCGTVETLPIAIYSMTRKKVSPEIYALSTILAPNAMESRGYRRNQRALRGGDAK